MINSGVRGLRGCGVSVRGSLNKSSHGALLAANETLPHHRAPKGQSIPRKATFTLCQDLLKKYFSQLKPQANLNKTALSED